MFKAIFTSLMAAILTLAAHVANAESVALVLGNSKYSPSIRAHSQAAQKTWAAVKKAGFVAFGGENLTRKETYVALQKFEARASKADSVLIFISGKFASKGNANWLLMPGTKSQSAIAMDRDAISLNAILSVLEGHSGNSAAFLSEGKGPIKSSYGLRSGLGALNLSGGSVVLRGTPAGLTDLATKAIARDVNLANMALPKGVRMVGYPGPDLVLNPSPRPVASLTTPVGSNTSADRAAWDIANTVDSEAAYRAYLERFPNGDFSGLARTRLTAATAPRANPAEIAEKSLKLNRNARRDVQRKLTLLGFSTRGVDGIFGGGSRDAITRFQRAEGFEPTGYLTSSMLRTLERRASIRQAEVEEEERRLKREKEDQDIRFWRSTGSSGRVDDLQAYLKRYPDGLYAGEAKRELERQGYGSSNEDSDWNRAFNADTIRSYEDYMAAYPRGKYRRDAEARIRVLRQNRIERPTRDAVNPATAEKALKLSQLDRASLELRLGSLGFNPGFPEGKIDKRARKAIAQFQERAGLTATGYFDRNTVNAIMKASKN